jgi:hypothetical protein
MSVEADLYAVLGPLVSGRAYPDLAAFGTTLPYVTYQQVGGNAVNFLNGIPDQRNGRFQINVWASTRVAASALIRQIEDALRLSTTLRATSEGGAVSEYEDELKLYGARQDFSVWFAA